MKRTTEMLFSLTNNGHRHVWVECDVTNPASPADSDDYETPEEHAMVFCLHEYGFSTGPQAVRDQYGKLVTRVVGAK